MAVNWVSFEDRLTDYISSSKTDDPDAFGKKIADEYYKTTATATNTLGAVPVTVNKEALTDSILTGFKMALLLLAPPSISLPIITMPSLPTIGRLAIPPIPILPGINIASFNIPVPNIPSMVLPSLPSIPGLSIPAIPGLPNIAIPTLSALISIPIIPSITLPGLPRIPNLALPVLPGLPNLSIPDISISAMKAKLVFSLALAIGIFKYWTLSTLALIPPPGAVVAVSNRIISQQFPSSTIPINNSDISELPRKIAQTSRLHLQTISGVTIGTTALGATITVPWQGLN